MQPPRAPCSAPFTLTHPPPFVPDTGHAGGIRCFLTDEDDDNYIRTFVRPYSKTLSQIRQKELTAVAEEVLGEAPALLEDAQVDMDEGS